MSNEFSIALIEDLADFKVGNALVEDIVDIHFDELFDYYLKSGEMPYGVAKARDGDPNTWLADRLEEEFAPQNQPVRVYSRHDEQLVEQATMAQRCEEELEYLSGGQDV